jgi:ABC-type lipoprotein release transport system permease subunit
MLCRLFCREIRHRWGTFLLGILALAVAAGALVAARVILASHDERTTELLEQATRRQDETLALMADEMRKAMLQLSFNCVVLPASQDLGEWYREDYGTQTMPEDYATRLSTSKIVSIRHILPSLQRRILWPEVNRHILLVGSRGEVPDLHRNPKKPMVQPVPEGSIVLGYELHQSLGLKPGDKTALMGREFTVGRCHEQRGSKDDITAWIPLPDAQNLLGEPGRINAILALECLCIGPDAIGVVRRDITGILPDTQVVEIGTRIIARAEARYKLGAAARETVAREKAAREELRRQREDRANLVSLTVVSVCAVWLVILATVNASQRREESALLRTLGLSTPRLLILLLGRALLAAVLGGLVGILLGCGTGCILARLLDGHAPPLATLPFRAIGLAFGSALVLALLAAWLPAFAAVLRDPAEELREH